MFLRLALVVALSSVALPTAAMQAAPVPSQPSQTEIQSMLNEKVSRDRRAVGAVLALVNEHGWQVYVAGETCEGQGAVNERTAFEIGSLTKPLTASAFYRMVEEGRLAADATVQSLLPDGSPGLAYEGNPMQLIHLVEHTSGLPRMPDDLTDESQYSTEQLYSFLSLFQLARKPGETRDYSNIGYGLLGVLLGRAANLPYSEMLDEAILTPLGMRDTFIDHPSHAVSLACGHDEALNPIAATVLAPTLEGAGGAKSTAVDMARFLQASFIGAEPFQVRWGRPQTVRGRTLFTHDGSTNGYASFMAYDPERRVGAVVLSNTRYVMDDLVLHLLDPDYPLVPRRTAIQVEATALESHTGTYRADDGAELSIQRHGSRLFLLRAGQLPRELFAETANAFFVDDARPVIFSTDEGASLVRAFRRDGTAQQSVRTGDVAPLFHEASEAELERLVGRYALGDDVFMDVRRDGVRLTAKITGQSELELLPLSDRRFTYKDVAAEVEFTLAVGPAKSLVILQGGDQTPAERIDWVER